MGRDHERTCESFFYFNKKKKKKGDNTYFLLPLFVRKRTIGVDDGVGGWIKKGVDAHANFMRNAMTAISPQQKPINGGVEVEPRKVLDNAFLHTKAKGFIHG